MPLNFPQLPQATSNEPPKQDTGGPYKRRGGEAPVENKKLNSVIRSVSVSAADPAPSFPTSASWSRISVCSPVLTGVVVRVKRERRR